VHINTTTTKGTTMDASTLRRGLVAGAIGGMAMAMWSMVVFAATGDGLWLPVNLIAHVGWAGAPLDGSFDAGALALGMMAHMALSMMLGAAIALIASRIGGGAAATGLVALGVATAAWAVGAVAWNAIDADGFEAFTPWVLATGHLMFAVATAAVLAGFERLHRDDPLPISRRDQVAVV
jgi:hypothetical protein